MAAPQRPIDRMLTAWRQRAIVLKAVSFGLVGIVNTAIDLSVFLAAYSVFELPLIPSNVLSWLVAMSCSYVMNSYITFARESGRREPVRIAAHRGVVQMDETDSMAAKERPWSAT